MAKTHRKPWLRLWDDLLTDPKMVDMTIAQIGIWCKLLCLANQQSERGLIVVEDRQGQPIRTLAKLLRVRSDMLETALRLFRDRNMVEFHLNNPQGWVHITNWHKRQFASDDVAERVRKFREKKRYSNVESKAKQSRTEESSDDLCSVPDVSSSQDDDDLETAPHQVTPSQSSFSVRGKTGPSREDTLSLAETVSKEHDYPELITEVEKCLSDGMQTHSLCFLLMDLRNFEPKGMMTPKVYLREQLKERGSILQKRR